MCAGTGPYLLPSRGLLVPQCGPCGCLRGVVQLSACADRFLTSPKPGAALGDRGSSFQYRQTLCGTVWFCSLPQRKCVRAECPGRALEQCSAGDTCVLQQHRQTSSFAGGAQGCVCAALSLPATPQHSHPGKGGLPLNIDGI